MKKIGSLLVAALFFLQYKIISRHSKGHGVHSPFIFDFVNKVLYDKTAYAEYQFFEFIISSLKASKEMLPVNDLGGVSIRFSNKSRKVPKLLKISSIPSKYGRLLFRMIRYYKPVSIVEFGTSIGVSAIFLAKGNTGSKLLTVEGNKLLFDFASGLFRKNNVKNIHAVHGDFDQIISHLPSKFTDTQFVFIDGNHKYDPTMRYFKYFMERMEEGIIIIDDIYWSGEMRRAWKEIVRKNRKYVTIDLYRMGIIILRDSVTPGHYVVRF